MLTYNLDSEKKMPLYEQLYSAIKSDILSNRIESGFKLPSKRNFAKNLAVSTITVESAYEMLLSEGFIFSVPKSGYFVSDCKNVYSADLSNDFTEENSDSSEKSAEKNDENAQNFDFDFVSSATLASLFPFSAMAHLTRKILAEKSDSIMRSSPSGGILELKRAICRHLEQFRALKANENQIVIGAGTEYLYSLLIQLLGFDKIWAVEDPGYTKIAQIYSAHRLRVAHIPMDLSGMCVDELKKSGAEIAHISPSHQFPTGITASVERRRELLSWAAEKSGRFIIEDDYDSELRLDSAPVPSLQSIDTAGKVIYINTFSRTLSSTLRVSYMVLPLSLSAIFYEKLGFYSNTVPVVNQRALAAFMTEGFFEKHINRLRRHYTAVRDELLLAIREADNRLSRAEITGENAGLHFLLNLSKLTEKSDAELADCAKNAGIKIRCLSEYFSNPENAVRGTLVVNYSSLPANPEKIRDVASRLASIL